MKNVDEYKLWRHQFEDYFNCEKYFMENHFENTDTVLDVGGSSGGFYGALREKYPNLNYTSLDTDEKALDIGRKLYPDANFFNSGFFEYTPKKRFSAVIYFQQLFLSPNWKEALNKLVSLADKNIFIESRFRLDGNTITDPEVSFSYYNGLKDFKWSDNAKRVPWIVVNVYEFVTYCLGSFPISRLEIYGYYQNPPPPHFIPMDRKKVVAACCWITLDRDNVEDGRNATVKWNLPDSNY
ncbi:MAG: class I SAM-dependent methyltransferase [Candidatus Scalindua sediminis]|nr:class I SAM-dependent methyltransferase [Candidatus Scalindua sediminis]